MVVHHGLLAELLALVAVEVKPSVSPVSLLVVGELFFEVVEAGFAAVRTVAVGAAGHLHLEEAEVEAHLEFLAAVESGDLADVDRAGLVVPAARARG